MERDGLVVREADPADARRALVRLTPHARMLREPLRKQLDATNAVAVDGLTDADVRRVRTLLLAIAENLDEDVGA